MTEGQPKPIRVVVVDDNAVVRDRVATLLTEAGMMVVSRCEDGMAAVGAAVALKPDVITMDLSMPRIDGIEALKLIMATCPTPVVVMSWMGRRGESLRKRARELGAVAVLSKPLDESGEPDIDRVAGRLVRLVRSAGRGQTTGGRTRSRAMGDRRESPGGGETTRSRRPWRWTG